MIFVIKFKNGKYLTYADTPLKSYTQTTSLLKAIKFTNKDTAIGLIQYYNYPAKLVCIND